MDTNKVDTQDSSLVNSSNFKFESFNSTSNTNIPEVDTPVLGVFSGIFAKLDSMSTNKRFYSTRFWNQVLRSRQVRDALSAGTMLGIMEHPSIKVDFNEDGVPTARHPQNCAFVTKKLWVEGKNIMGEGYILNTPPGKILATMFLAKDKYGKSLIELYVSARGYSRRDYIDSSGIDQMNPDDYLLQAFDIVMNPGIKGTRAKMESELLGFNTPEDLEVFLNSTDTIDKFESFPNEIQSHFKNQSIVAELRDELNLKSI